MDILDEMIGDSKPQDTSEVSAAPAEAPATPDAPETAEATEAAPESATTETPEAPSYTNIVGTYDTEDEANAAFPDDQLVSVATFASLATVHYVTKGDGIAGIVKDSAVYARVKAVNYALPVVLVAGSVLLPYNAALTAWESKPATSAAASRSASGVLSDERLAVLTFKVLDRKAAAEKALARATERLDKVNKVAAMRTEQAKARWGEDGWMAKVDAAQEAAEADKTITDEDSE